ncbi:class I SAM-dependent methyltransferase (plasmid) [Nitratireductor rhodophyticola]|jgi:SAM-dependent methyltransferase|uniref:Class I SAM-dependent methyltransferase n=1 Tax=Nitratireductor rhodophyticola TaxID=2854036 RepID=A0ABS7REY6_9HYPH|nr:class I SAM-dependent methyltransferase [Nitratireductor rhodophyticola]MAS15425.1 hypothetical protein [Nitratireductor sp.]MBY8918970.1 class I SAM-dependent methyltransferase [Nitratireductor rhodophyticola]MEC9245879.1 class I SAM-dependent methyltransferase [Pseudomonadota bacterium]MBY8922975.1 class I SAM-dependent methyltransferase [Nitratireductor rhodophyticola]WPZ16407.1 class I SAM-dependent methyltransferase [Nitratireductor rhodophyticola]
MAQLVPTPLPSAVNRITFLARPVFGWRACFGHKNLDILEVGCGSGWLCPRLLPYGRVTGTDLSDAVVERARRRPPEVAFVPGDFMDLDFGLRD